MVSLALFQPDQAGNVGTLLRLSACLQIKLHIIHPCGFAFSDKSLRRSAMDYISYADYQTYDDYREFEKQTKSQRKILLTTKATENYTKFSFHPTDILLLGQESAGVPPYVHDAVEEKVKIIMHPEVRSINMALSGAMILGEAIRQTI